MTFKKHARPNKAGFSGTKPYIMKIYILIRANGDDGFDEPYNYQGFTDEAKAQELCDKLNKGHYTGYDVTEIDVDI